MENIIVYEIIITNLIRVKINDKFIMMVDIKDEIKNELKKIIKIIDFNNEIQILKMLTKLETNIFPENEKRIHFN